MNTKVSNIEKIYFKRIAKTNLTPFGIYDRRRSYNVGSSYRSGKRYRDRRNSGDSGFGGFNHVTLGEKKC